MTFDVDKSIIRELCDKYGSQLHLPAGIDGSKLMWAISGAESSFGRNCTPRCEPAYDEGGRYASNPEQAALLAQYGHRAACSYGPWQVMLCNAAQFTPLELLTDPDKCAQAFVGFFNRFVIGVRRAGTVNEMAQTYNSGRFRPNPAPGVLRYAKQVEDYYLSGS